MAITYNNTNWETGKVITASALNGIEEGIVNLVAAVNNMDTSVVSNTLTIGGTVGEQVTSNNDGNLKVDNRVYAGKLQVGGEITDTLDSGDALISGDVEIKGSVTLDNPGTQDSSAVRRDYVTGAVNRIDESISTITGNINSINGSINTINGSITTINQSITGINGKTIDPGDGLTVNGTIGSANGIELSLDPATTSTIGGVKVGSNLSINANGELSGAYSVASTSNNGLMSSAMYDKLNSAITNIQVNGTPLSVTNNSVNLTNIVTGITMNGSACPITDGSVDLGTVVQDITSKANSANPVFSGIVTVGSLITLNGINNTITIGNTVLDETLLNQLIALIPQSEPEPEPDPEQEPDGGE